MIKLGCAEWVSRLSSSDVVAHSSANLAHTISTSSSLENFEPTDGDSLIPELLPEHIHTTKSEDQIAFETLYDALNSDEKAAIDQWWKWSPGRWITSERKRSGAIPSRDRLKAWQVAMVGIIRDWMTIEDFPKKYSVLVALLCNKTEANQQESSLSDSKSTGAEHDLMTEDASLQQDSDSEDPDIAQYGLRKKRRIIKSEDEDEEIDDSEFDEDDAHSSPIRKVKKPTRKSSRQVPANDHKKKPSGSRKGPSRKDPAEMSFDLLCATTERGFAQTNAEERILILRFLITTCAQSSTMIHAYVDDCLEKISEFKRERRLIVRERKSL